MGPQTALDHFIKACNKLGNFSHNNKHGCKFQMREHRNNVWKVLTLGLANSIPLRDATLRGWSADDNPCLRQDFKKSYLCCLYWTISKFYEVVDVVKENNLTCLECRGIGGFDRYEPSW